MTDEKGNVQDLTNEIVWFANEAGKYELTYTINSGAKKGTSKFTFNVTYPELTWEFSLQNLPYNFGQTLIFEDYFNDNFGILPEDYFYLLLSQKIFNRPDEIARRFPQHNFETTAEKRRREEKNKSKEMQKCCGKTRFKMKENMNC